MNVGVIGAGSWGTALAKLAVEAGHSVKIWAYEPEVVEQINGLHRNESYLPDIELPPSLVATGQIAEVVEAAKLIISAVPSHFTRSVWKELAPMVDGTPLIASATKGIENDTLLTIVELLRDLLPQRLHGGLLVLSGPSFALEVGQRLPTAVVAAAAQMQTARDLQAALSTDRFRIYTSTDVAGVEVAGAAKNVVAIASGIADGLGFGHNTRAALITRGVAEITRLAVAKGATPLTLAGLAGMGDLVLTCTGALSRNRTVGLKLGQAQSLEEIQGAMTMVAEGIRSAKSCLRLAERLEVEMPITKVVHDVLYEGLPPREATERLMGRQLKHELEHQP